MDDNSKFIVESKGDIVTRTIEMSISNKGAGTKLYVGQSGNISNRLLQHAKSGRVTNTAWRIPVRGAKAVRETYESLMLKSMGSHKAPWMSNKMNPRKISNWRFR